jgi:hypothetical protein
MYASNKIREIKEVWGKRYDHLDITLKFTIPGVLQSSITQYVMRMIQEIPKKLSGKLRCPWSKNLYNVGKNSPKLSENKSKIFHTFVMKRMFVCKCARQNMLPGIVFLATWVKDLNQQDCIKQIKRMNYFKSTQDNIPKMSADDSQTMKWYIDSSFAVYKDMRSHTGAIMTLRKGVIISESTKQKVNLWGLTESKMIAVNNMISKLL